jgi:hypothetical protein
MLAALTNKKLMNGIKKASPIGQTSCLEGSLRSRRFLGEVAGGEN